MKLPDFVTNRLTPEHAQELQALVGWRPIADAPRDGTHVLLRIHGVAIEGWWTEDVGWEVIYLSSHGCGCCSSENDKPTHYAILPYLEK